MAPRVGLYLQSMTGYGCIFVRFKSLEFNAVMQGMARSFYRTALTSTQN